MAYGRYMSRSGGRRYSRPAAAASIQRAYRRSTAARTSRLARVTKVAKRVVLDSQETVVCRKTTGCAQFLSTGMSFIWASPIRMLQSNWGSASLAQRGATVDTGYNYLDTTAYLRQGHQITGLSMNIRVAIDPFQMGLDYSVTQEHQVNAAGTDLNASYVPSKTYKIMVIEYTPCVSVLTSLHARRRPRPSYHVPQPLPIKDPMANPVDVYEFFRRLFATVHHMAYKKDHEGHLVRQHNSGTDPGSDAVHASGLDSTNGPLLDFVDGLGGTKTFRVPSALSHLSFPQSMFRKYEGAIEIGITPDDGRARIAGTFQRLSSSPLSLDFLIGDFLNPGSLHVTGSSNVADVQNLVHNWTMNPSGVTYEADGKRLQHILTEWYQANFLARIAVRLVLDSAGFASSSPTQSPDWWNGSLGDFRFDLNWSSKKSWGNFFIACAYLAADPKDHRGPIQPEVPLFSTIFPWFNLYLPILDHGIEVEDWQSMNGDKTVHTDYSMYNFRHLVGTIYYRFLNVISSIGFSLNYAEKVVAKLFTGSSAASEAEVISVLQSPTTYNEKLQEYLRDFFQLGPDASLDDASWQDLVNTQVDSSHIGSVLDHTEFCELIERMGLKVFGNFTQFQIYDELVRFQVPNAFPSNEAGFHSLAHFDPSEIPEWPTYLNAAGEEMLQQIHALGKQIASSVFLAWLAKHATRSHSSHIRLLEDHTDYLWRLYTYGRRAFPNHHFSARAAQKVRTNQFLCKADTYRSCLRMCAG